MNNIRGGKKTDVWVLCGTARKEREGRRGGGEKEGEERSETAREGKGKGRGVLTGRGGKG